MQNVLFSVLPGKWNRKITNLCNTYRKIRIKNRITWKIVFLEIVRFAM